MDMDSQADRVKRVERFIEEHYGEILDLDALAAEACLSRFHFSRVFALHTGEGPFEYLGRVRIQSAARELATSDNKIADIAYRCGFGSLSAFNAAFRSRFGSSPSAYRKDSKNRQDLGKDQGESESAIVHARPTEFTRRVLEMNVKVIDLPAMDIAYVRKKGSLLDTRPAWDVLLAWAAERGLAPPAQLYFGIADDPKLVRAEECAFCACVSLPEGFAKDHGPVEYDSLAGGTNAAYEFYDSPDRLGFAYGIIINEWLPSSGYRQDPGRPCIEISWNDLSKDPEGRARVRICVPVLKKG
jgi:AraC family transcriptional regulator